MLDKAQLKDKYQQLLKRLARLDEAYETVEYDEIPALDKQIERVTSELDEIEAKLDSLI